QLLTQIGPGTPMGDLMRQYWMPIYLSADIAEPDGKPHKIKLLGENLIIFRDTEGRVGLITEVCPHRGASLYWSRNEQGGVRCVYHGWKFDVTGQCMDMPSEPVASNFWQKVTTLAYPCQERNGIVWTYMGPREAPPPLPELEFNLLPQEHLLIRRDLQETNWVQGLEGNIDSSHLSFLHTRLDGKGSAEFYGKAPANRGLFYVDPAPKMEVVKTDAGVMYGAGRAEEPGKVYWRITQFLMPFYGMFAPVSLAECPMQWWIPLDDNAVMKWDIRWNPSRPITDEERTFLVGPDPGGFVEWTHDPYTHWRLKADRENDYLNDYDAQLERRFSGIPSVNLQDKAVLESMGHVVDRRNEHLGTSDAMIIGVRKRLIQAAKDLRDHGTVPPGVDDPDVYRRRTATGILNSGDDWQAEIGPYLEAFSDHPVLSAEAQQASMRVGRPT
ncbi:MAG: Rieske 2Fe-2S domain-containing protein, partial [Chloroflexi bacterium]|nr:Rieske 2Fe-2S domain-containing protein [Chloroflexota bacterium]